MLREELQLLADTAPDYTDAERALASYRINRRRRLVVGAAAVAVLAVIVSLVYLMPNPSAVDNDPPWIVPAGPIEPSYPPELRLGTQPVPALPNGTVGPALLAAHTSAREQCAPACPEAVLFTVAGERYALPVGADGSLSPDGRWLLGVFGQSVYALRDLTTDAAPRTLDADARSRDRWQPMAWSPDSRWLLLWRLRNGTLNDYQRVEVATGRAVTGTLPAGEQPLAMLSSGDLLTGPTAATHPLRAEPVTLRIVDPDGASERARVGLGAVLAADRTLANGGPVPALVTPDGHNVVLTLNGSGTVLATVDLRTGHLVRGQLLADGWHAVAATSRGIVVTSTAQSGQEPFDTVVGVVEPSTAAAGPTVITRVIRGGSVMLRGGTGSS